MKRRRIEPGPGQESVWDYPRPPGLERVSKRIEIGFAGRSLANTTSAYRVLETSHPPSYYLPPADIDFSMLQQSERSSFCEWKGQAIYYDLVCGTETFASAAWAYPLPTARFAAIAGYVSVYAHALDVCRVADEDVEPQPGDFYGGWVTSEIIGPFKGAAGTWGW
ncbi:MAG: hypothetical protein ACI81R_003751 [Bradymonadia bacterium]|jgi:uncharacterized protein (DUF427 family)